jgi:hypothetical protein
MAKRMQGATADHPSASSDAGSGHGAAERSSTSLAASLGYGAAEERLELNCRQVLVSLDIISQ